ncbi:MAG: hypothetical protein H6Q68_724 [Firmicutes bacterium]|nr:hypothetical protein [Bacillota bacterium]
MASQGSLVTHKSSSYNNLVIVRAGDHSLHRRWLYPAEYKNFDLAISYFGDSEGLYADDCDFYEHVKGPKFLPLYDLIINNIDYILQYDAIWLSEDDLDCDAKTIHEMFRIFHEHELWLAQPSLTTDSYYSHAITLKKPGLLLRYTNFVEIMAPIFAKQALLQCLSTFNKSQSGWGLELAWPKILGDPVDKIAILDAVSIRHTRQVRSGTLYNVISADPDLEWQLMAKTYNVPLPFEYLTYKEVSSTGAHH